MPAAKKRNLFVIVQDRSGSMSQRRQETIEGFNAYIEDLKEKGKGTNLVSLVQFDDKVNVVYENTKLKNVEPLNHETYTIGAYTALHDGVGKAIALADAEAGDKDRVTIVVMTDGWENSSKEFNAEGIKKAIAEREEKGNWTFVYMGAGKDAWSGGAGLGIKVGNTLNYGTDAHDHGVAFRSLATASVVRTEQKNARTDTYFADANVDNEELAKSSS